MRLGWVMIGTSEAVEGDAMATNNMQKRKILALMDILKTETDPAHGLTMPQLIAKLGARGIEAERKGIYRDIEALREFGMDITKLKRQPVQYALRTRAFDFSQLTLLIDAVQSSKFLSDRSSKELVESIKKLASVEERKRLNKQVHVYGRPKRQDRSDFKTVDLLQEALAKQRKASFVYFKYDASKKQVARKRNARHVVTPVCLTYSEGNYYLVAYSDADAQIRNYRVDRMKAAAIVDQPAEQNDEIAAYDPNKASRTAFGMYKGTCISASIKVDAALMNVVVDRFSRDVSATPVEGGRAAVINVSVQPSPVFYGWLAILGDQAEILAPDSLREDYAAWLGRILGKYRE